MRCDAHPVSRVLRVALALGCLAVAAGDAAAISCRVADGEGGRYLELDGLPAGPGEIVIARDGRELLRHPTDAARPARIGPIRGEILAGDYDVSFAGPSADPDTPEPSRVTLPGRNVPVDVLRRDLIDMLARLRRIYLTLAQYGEFLPARFAQFARPVPDSVRDAMRGRWSQVGVYLERLRAELRADVQAYREAWFLDPFPGAAAGLGDLIERTGAWQGQISHALDDTLGASEAAPAEVEAIRQLRADVRQDIDRAYSLLAATPAGWDDPLDLARPEAGTENRAARTYRSSLGFEVGWPEGWRMSRGAYDPAHRVTLRPPEGGGGEYATVLVADFPDCASYDELIEHIEVELLWETWAEQSYLRLHAVATSDPPGYRVRFRVIQEGRPVEVIARYLFRGTDRVVCVLGFAPADRFAEAEGALSAVADSLRLVTGGGGGG